MRLTVRLICILSCADLTRVSKKPFICLFDILSYEEANNYPSTFNKNRTCSAEDGGYVM